MKKLFLYLVLMGVGFFGAPLTMVLVMGRTSPENGSAKDPMDMSMDELLQAEREVVSKHESNIQVLAISSIVGVIAGALLAAGLSSKAKPSGAPETGRV